MGRVRSIYSLFAFLAALSVQSGSSSADGDVERGRAFAEKNCGRCHATGAGDVSPLEKAPAFRSFVERWPVEYLAESLAEGIVTGHAEMPEFKLSPEEISDFLAYLNSWHQE